MQTKPTEQQAEWLLHDLCVKLGFCLPPAENQRLIENPPLDLDAFINAVFVAEGMDPDGNQHLRRQVRDCISSHMKAWESADQSSIYSILSERYRSGDAGGSERHNEHQP